MPGPQVGRLIFLQPKSLQPPDSKASVPPIVILRERQMTTSRRTIAKIVPSAR